MNPGTVILKYAHDLREKKYFDGKTWLFIMFRRSADLFFGAHNIVEPQPDEQYITVSGGNRDFQFLLFFNSFGLLGRIF